MHRLLGAPAGSASWCTTPPAAPPALRRPGSPTAPAPVGAADGPPQRRPAGRSGADGARTLVQEWGYRCLKTHLGLGERLEATDRVGRSPSDSPPCARGPGRTSRWRSTSTTPPRHRRAADRGPGPAAPPVHRGAHAGGAGGGPGPDARGAGGGCRSPPASAGWASGVFFDAPLAGAAGRRPVGPVPRRGDHRVQEDRRHGRGGYGPGGPALPPEPHRAGRLGPAGRLPAQLPRPGAQRGQQLARGGDAP